MERQTSDDHDSQIQADEPSPSSSNIQIDTAEAEYSPTSGNDSSPDCEERGDTSNSFQQNMAQRASIEVQPLTLA